MQAMRIFSGALILISIAVLLGLWYANGHLNRRAYRIFAVFACLIMPLIALAGGWTTVTDQSKKTEFCGSCHVMRPMVRSLHSTESDYIPAVHYMNNYVPKESACYSCHTQYTWYGGANSKYRGLMHLAKFYTSAPSPDKIKLYSPYQNRECLHCHAGARKFEKKKAHNSEEAPLAKIMSGEISCISSGCHDVVHEVEEFMEAKGDDK